MTMRRACGFEVGSLDVLDSYGGTTVSINGTARTGNYSLASTFVTGWGQLSLGVGGVSEWYFQVAVYPTQMPGPEDWGNIIAFYDRNGVLHCCVKVSSTGAIGAFYSTGTNRGTSVVTINVSEWSCLEIHVVLGDAGNIEIRKNGVSILSLAGVDLYNNAGLLEIQTVRFSYLDANNTNLRGLWDDFVANDTTGAQNNSWPNQLGLYPVKPEGVGTTTQLTPTAGVNWDNVEETPPNDGDYVYSDTLNQFDTYQATDVTVAGLVRAVIKWGRAREDVAAPRNFAHMWRLDGTDYTGGDLAIDTSFDYYDEIDELSPDTGVPFTTGEINAAEIGVKVR